MRLTRARVRPCPEIRKKFQARAKSTANQFERLILSGPINDSDSHTVTSDGARAETLFCIPTNRTEQNRISIHCFLQLYTSYET